MITYLWFEYWKTHAHSEKNSCFICIRGGWYTGRNGTLWGNSGIEGFLPGSKRPPVELTHRTRTGILKFCQKIMRHICLLKLNYRKRVFYFALNFYPRKFLLIKKLDFEKTKATKYTTFKTDIRSGLSFFDFQLFY